MLKVKEYRKQAGLTREQLAVAAGITGRTVENIEAGKDTRVSTLRAIAKALDISVIWLFEDTGDAA